MKKIFIAAFGVLCALAACQDEESSTQLQPRKDISLTRAEKEMADKGTEFAFRFFNQINQTEQEQDNWMISPLSASFCLSMLANGADGNTLDEMKTVLGFSGYSLEEMNEYNRKLLDELPGLDNSTRMALANSIWVDNQFDVYDNFVQVNRDWYDAGYGKLDFASPDAKDAMNRWCAENTNNLITDFVKKTEKGDLFYVLDALYFKGIWETKFNKANTQEKDFTNADGSRSKVAMMRMERETFNGMQNEYFSLTEFPYGNRAFSMVVLLPNEKTPLEKCFPLLTAESWNEWMQQLRPFSLNVEFPRFELEYAKLLGEDLKALGMEEAFDKTQADFSKMSSQAVHVSEVKQGTFIKVDEEGTEAAAVTGGKGDISPGLESGIFHINRPFAFLIKERSTGIILFMGKVTKL